ncbi:MAG TPA: RsmE family RNA methyltransferase [Kofleriaceae bacterium]|nr:RsmE family RNA methyltransferase [Kofleriaceae bacterium]
MRIVVPELRAGELAITGDDHHYLGRVRRVRVGDALELVDGVGHRASAKIVRMSDAETVVEVGPVEVVNEPRPHVRVMLPLIKGDRMDYALEKLVEVGANEVIVWQAEHSVVRLDASKRDARIAHYAAVIEAAAKQSGRATIPSVRFAELRAALRGLPEGGRYVLEQGAERGEVSGDDVTIISGPEGGLTWIESEQLVAAGFRALGLGPNVLRAETAPVVAVAMIKNRP